MHSHAHSRFLLLLIIVLVSLAIMSGCSDDDNPTAVVAPTFTRDFAARFSVRSGTTIDPGNLIGVFGGSNSDQAMIEFPLDFEATARVEITVQVRDSIVGPSDPLLVFLVAAYEADGVANTGDFNSGAEFEVLGMNSGANKSFAIDVTEQVAELRTAGATHIGLRFFDLNFGQLFVVTGELVAGP